MIDEWKCYRNVCRCFRDFMKHQGFSSIGIVRMQDCDDVRFVVSAYDVLSEKAFCRIYTPDDMRCITRANGIFWRFIK